VASTVEQARAAAEAIKVNYAKTEHNTSDTLLGTPISEPTPKQVTKRGDTTAALGSAAIKHDAVYSTPTETHNPIELHASVAVYQDGKFTLYETSQAVVNHRDVLAAMLGVPPEDVQVITRFLGSGFGGKLWPWPQSALTAACARNLKRPVKLVVSRSMMFQSVGHRWLHHREGLRALGYAAQSGDVRAADASAGRGAGGLRRSRGRDRWR
jgi:xanthine dehydrogenase YagR molybdenum-binding subunit